MKLWNLWFIMGLDPGLPERQTTALHDGNTGQVKRGSPTYRRREGENIRVECKFSYSGTKKFFCKGKCEKRNILIETTKNTAKNDRYSIQYVEKSVLSSDILYVSIGQLKKSDTGPYMCLSKTWLGDLSHEFYILVTEGSTTKTETATTTTSTTKTTKAIPTTETSVFSSESAGVSSVSPETSKQPQRSPASSAAAGMLPYVGLFLAIMIILFSAALLIFCKNKRASKDKGPLENENGDITPMNQLYEEVREMDTLPPLGVSSAYTYPKYSQSHGFENIDFHSLSTPPQNTAEDNSSTLHYSEVDFSHIPATNSAPSRNATDAIYSTLVVYTSPSSHTKDSSSPLYSAV
ncbi:uncharacterized protein LOC113013348 isoform X3 [Astatotilapia calliptera]|uniref:uncharacterized protein LOC113013348 isoform X3 n=1 Tax=Astatotilapia calliptera TaxID=8154 RepID=UPI000E40195A|nr:uncharacterized protein LOC113013348 isoform X3 [Astatotilapia calliptera]